MDENQNYILENSEYDVWRLLQWKACLDHITEIFSDLSGHPAVRAVNQKVDDIIRTLNDNGDNKVIERLKGNVLGFYGVFFSENINGDINQFINTMCDEYLLLIAGNSDQNQNIPPLYGNIPPYIYD
ncbi:MAG: hypothetical protein GF364_02150 [Candidatus Lokiarchaeota archaeon]|nr:hypothetical protein [Candidatus Lokiarchaeota archaeon]